MRIIKFAAVALIAALASQTNAIELDAGSDAEFNYGKAITSQFGKGKAAAASNDDAAAAKAQAANKPAAAKANDTAVAAAKKEVPAHAVSATGKKFGNDLASDIAVWNQLEMEMDWDAYDWAKIRAMIDIYGPNGPVDPISKGKAMMAAAERRVMMNLHDKVQAGTADKYQIEKYNDMKNNSAELNWWVTNAKKHKEYMAIAKKYNF